MQTCPPFFGFVATYADRKVYMLKPCYRTEKQYDCLMKLNTPWLQDTESFIWCNELILRALLTPARKSQLIATTTIFESI